MAQDDDPASFDVDAIQAQIDLAMSMTEDIVAGWVKPSASGSGSKSSLAQKKKTFEETERELEAYMRKPPRLGVGAPIPDAGGPGTREAMALRNKMAGHSKKRDSHKDSTSSAMPNGAVDEDDEEIETKGSSGHNSNSKRNRVDPFSAPKKKSKQLSQSTSAQQLSTLTPSDTTISANGGVTADGHTGKEEATPEAPSAPQENGTTSTPLMPETKKKKKKRKREASDGNDEARSASTSDKPSLFVNFSFMRTNGDLLSPSPSTSRTSTANDTNETESPVEYEEEEEWTGFSIPLADDNEAAEVEVTPGASPPSLPSIPLLNLNGPPLSEDDERGGDRASKKKRKKKRKAIEPKTCP